MGRGQEKGRGGEGFPVEGGASLGGAAGLGRWRGLRRGGASLYDLCRMCALARMGVRVCACVYICMCKLCQCIVSTSVQPLCLQCTFQKDHRVLSFCSSLWEGCGPCLWAWPERRPRCCEMPWTHPRDAALWPNSRLLESTPACLEPTGPPDLGSRGRDGKVMAGASAQGCGGVSPPSTCKPWLGGQRGPGE